MIKSYLDDNSSIFACDSLRAAKASCSCFVKLSTCSLLMSSNLRAMPPIVRTDVDAHDIGTARRQKLLYGAITSCSRTIEREHILTSRLPSPYPASCFSHWTTHFRSAALLISARHSLDPVVLSARLAPQFFPPYVYCWI